MSTLKATITADDKAVVMTVVPSKEFSTGSKGYYANGKAEIDGKRYQFSVQLVEIGSKKANGK